jgi:hypothetical protein
MAALSPRVGKYNTAELRPRKAASGWMTTIAGRMGFGADSRIYGEKLRLSFWLAAILGIFPFKVFGSLALKPDSRLVEYGGIPYFLLLLAATGFAIRDGIDTAHPRSGVRSKPNCGTEIIADVPRISSEDATQTKSQVVGG